MNSALSVLQPSTPVNTFVDQSQIISLTMYKKRITDI